MNIFYTHHNPIQAAREHCISHRNKMIVEYAQLLSTEHHVLDGDKAIDGIYKKTHENHPCAKWVRSSLNHYQWVFICAAQLCGLYRQQRKCAHKTESILKILNKYPINIPIDVGFGVPPKCMPDFYNDVGAYVEQCYHNYLNAKFKDWLTRDKRPLKVEFTCGIPSWYHIS